MVLIYDFYMFYKAVYCTNLMF